MSLSIDLTTHGKQLQQVYDSIISGSAATSWAVFAYDKGASNELKVQSTGAGELQDMVDEFNDGRISYGFVRVEDPNTRLNKFVLIGWCGEGVPEHKKGLFHSHFLAVAKFLKGYHVQITARSEADLDPNVIMNKVADSSGSKYSSIMSKFETSPQSKRGPPISPSVSAAFGRSTGYSLGVKKAEPKKDDDGWGDAPSTSTNAPSIVKSAYQPTKVDMASLRAGKSDSTSSATPEVIRGSYTPVGKVDIAAIRAQAKEQEQHSQSQSSQPRQQRPPEPDRDTYVGTSGYKPVQLPPPKPLGGGTSKFGPSITSRGGTVAPMPTGPVKESKAIGGASKNFGTDASGKTPSQLWAERKARERGQVPGHGVIPDIAPQKPLSRGTEPPVSPGTYVEDSAAMIGTGGASGGVKAMRDRFARQSIGDEDSSALPISPGRGPPPRKDFSSRMAPSPPSPPSPPAAPSPPPVAVSSKPPPRTYQSLDHVVSAGAGAGVGLGVGVLASQAMHHEQEPEEEHEPEPAPRSPSPPPPAPSQDTWATSAGQDPVSEDEEDMAARQQSQMHAEHTYEPEPETDHEQHQKQEVSRLESGAQSSKSAVVLFEYEAQEENEISLIEGQIITNIEFIDDGWWSGENPSGNAGLFPSNYVELQEHDSSSLPAVPLSTSHDPAHQPDHHEPHSEPEEHDIKHADEGETAIAEYDYEAQEDNELSFPEGARITNIERVDEAWWAGEYNGQQGLFPSNYVTME